MPRRKRTLRQHEVIEASVRLMLTEQTDRCKRATAASRSLGRHKEFSDSTKTIANVNTYEQIPLLNTRTPAVNFCRALRKMREQQSELNGENCRQHQEIIRGLPSEKICQNRVHKKSKQL